MPYLAWEGITKSFGGAPALAGVDLSMERGEILALLGPSGCGKTTLLRITAGLETPDAGRVLLESRDLSGIPAHKRGIGLMFQDYNLFPHLRAGANIGFGLRMTGWKADRRKARIREMLELVRLEGCGERTVHSLSGGEQQRVALARSLAPSPALLMLDEPLGALDAVLRDGLLAEIPAIMRKAGATAVYVTHDQAEALAVSDRVALMNGGRIVQVGTPRRVVRHPANAFAAGFLKLGALVPASWTGDGIVKTDIGSFKGIEGPNGSPEGYLLIRPSAVRSAAEEGMHELKARIGACSPDADGTEVTLELGGSGNTRYVVRVRWSDDNAERAWPPPRGSGITVGLDVKKLEALSP